MDAENLSRLADYLENAAVEAADFLDPRTDPAVRLSSFARLIGQAEAVAFVLRQSAPAAPAPLEEIRQMVDGFWSVDLDDALAQWRAKAGQ